MCCNLRDGNADAGHLEARRATGSHTRANGNDMKSEETASPDPHHMQCLWLAHEKLKSENELTNQRLAWNFSFNTLLFGVYAICIQGIWSLQEKLANFGDITTKNRELHVTLSQTYGALKEALRWIPLSGIVVSLVIFLGALGAQIAILNIRNKHEAGHAPDACTAHPAHGIHWPPRLVGGGSTVAHILGLAPLLIPLVFVVIWWRLEGLGPQ
jgi:hypothetical protein